MNSTTSTMSAVLPTYVGRRVHLGDRYSVCKHFYRAVWWQVAACLPELNADITYTAKEIMGDRFWREVMKSGDHCKSGMCLGHMVDTGMFPPLSAVPGSKSPRLYRLK